MSDQETQKPENTKTTSDEILMLDVLLEKMALYNPDFDRDLVTRACTYAKAMHGEQLRASGDPYYVHPIEVACLLADMKMDMDTVVTAILHDTVEDTDVTLTDLEKLFSKNVATLVNGVSKLTRVESQTVEGKQAENFRKLVLAMSEDIRVLLVKLADRLHNMRTLHHIPKESKRRRIARETIEIYAPIAERIGLHNLKEELEDLVFTHMNPEARETITNRLSFLRKEGTEIVKMIIGEMTALLKKGGVDADIRGREKTRYSIWRKMQRKNVAFEQLSDIMAFRVIVDTIDQCYAVLGIIHNKYPTVPGRFKDYISTPKPNGYSSIHTTVIGPDNQRIEVQIRTRAMDEEADLGVAAHWAYKDGGKLSSQKDLNKYRWLRELLDIIDQEGRPEEFLENTKLELFEDKVFVFTTKGDLIELPNGATPIDFAYGIHSEVGDKCVGAKINGRITPLNTKLVNGDQIEIITAKNQTPSPTWERFVVTGKARSRIRRYVRMQQRNEYVTLGKAMLQRIFQQEGYKFTEKAVGGVITQFRMETAEDIFAGIGSGNIVAREVFKAIFPGHQTATAKRPTDADTENADNNDEFIVSGSGQASRKKASGSAPLAIKGLIPGMAVHFARCCHPLPGDRIVGIVTTGKGVTVHTIDCDTLENFADTPERWIDVSWDDGPNSPESHVGRLDVTIANEPGALGTLSTVIGKNGGNITNLKITSRSLDFWEMMVDVYVNDTKHLHNIIAALRATPEITSVDRARGR